MTLKELCKKLTGGGAFDPALTDVELDLSGGDDLDWGNAFDPIDPAIDALLDFPKPEPMKSIDIRDALNGYMDDVKVKPNTARQSLRDEFIKILNGARENTNEPEKLLSELIFDEMIPELAKLPIDPRDKLALISYIASELKPLLPVPELG